MAKSAEAFRTISEVAEELGVPKHVLRFWELKFAHIRPMKRGGGRRFYRPEDMELLRAIRNLLHREGYTIRGVQRLLREQGVDAVKQRGKSAPTPTPTTARPGKPKVRPPEPPTRAARGTNNASAARTSATARELTGEMRSRIAAAIVELETCRAMLSERTAQAPARSRGASR
jgi:DNA-binding transcriptional MerR regulator